MYTFVSEQEEKVSDTMNNLIDSILELEELGSLSDEDVDECIYYLQKVAEISGSEIDLDDFNDRI